MKQHFPSEEPLRVTGAVLGSKVLTKDRVKRIKTSRCFGVIGNTSLRILIREAPKCYRKCHIPPGALGFSLILGSSSRIVRDDSRELSGCKCRNSSALFAHSDGGLAVRGRGEAQHAVSVDAFKLKIQVSASRCIINRRGHSRNERSHACERASAAN
ncbi:uncharacterized protein V6R79_021321 [Siganus canaliculatus]